MSLPKPRIIFGIHEFTPYSRFDNSFYGTIRVLGSSSLSLSGELIKLNGGSNRYPWDIQDGTITAELSLSIKEYPDFVFELFLGKKPTAITPSNTGAVSAMTNSRGTSAMSATIGIASVQALTGSEADMKFGKYVVKVVSATTVDVFASTDVDFQRGTDKEYVDGLLKINNAPLTIAQSADVTVPGFGIEFTGGSGTIGMTVGDTAIFEVLPRNSGGMEVNIGANSDVFPEFGAIMIAEQKSDGSMLDVEAFRVKALGLPIGLTEKAYSEAEITAECFYDSVQNRVLRIRHVEAI